MIPFKSKWKKPGKHEYGEDPKSDFNHNLIGSKDEMTIGLFYLRSNLMIYFILVTS